MQPAWQLSHWSILQAPDDWPTMESHNFSSDWPYEGQIHMPRRSSLYQNAKGTKSVPNNKSFSPRLPITKGIGQKHPWQVFLEDSTGSFRGHLSCSVRGWNKSSGRQSTCSACIANQRKCGRLYSAPCRELPPPNLYVFMMAIPHGFQSTTAQIVYLHSSIFWYHSSKLM